jgi:KDO2-lipid IV(A) lauroyltransferase
VELFSFPFLTKKDVLDQFEFQNLEKLHKAFEPGKGVFMISVHVANGDLATAALSHKGFPMNLISKVFASEWLNDFWFKGREHHGTHFIPPRRSSYEILKALKKNEMVVFVLDQYTAPPNGVVTEFFGIKTGTAHGLALLAERSGATVIPAFTYRKSFGDNVVAVGDPIPFEPRATKEETLRHNTQNYCDAVEAMVRQKPEQWMWVHRRWKPAWITDENGEYQLLPEETTWPLRSKQ